MGRRGEDGERENKNYGNLLSVIASLIPLLLEDSSPLKCFHFMFENNFGRTDEREDQRTNGHVNGRTNAWTSAISYRDCVYIVAPKQ